eukprot:447308_1
MANLRNIPTGFSAIWNPQIQNWQLVRNVSRIHASHTHTSFNGVHQQPIYNDHTNNNVILHHPSQHINEWNKPHPNLPQKKQNKVFDKEQRENSHLLNPILRDLSFKMFTSTQKEDGEKQHICILKKEDEHLCPKFSNMAARLNDQCIHHNPFKPHIWCFHKHSLKVIVLDFYVNKQIRYTHWDQHLKRKYHEEWRKKEVKKLQPHIDDKKRENTLKKNLPSISSCPSYNSIIINDNNNNNNNNNNND